MAEEIFAQVVVQQQARKPQLEAEAKWPQRERQQKAEQVKRLVTVIGTAKGPLASITESLAKLESAVRCIDQRFAAIREELVTLHGQAIEKEAVATAPAQLDALWQVLYPQEKVRIVNLLAEKVEYQSLISAYRVANSAYLDVLRLFVEQLGKCVSSLNAISA